MSHARAPAIVTWCAVLTVASICCGPLLASTPAALGWSDPALPDRARQVPVSSALLIDGVPLAADGPPAVFELERFRVFAPDARVVVHGETDPVAIPPPDNAYFRGAVVGRSGSRVFLTAPERGGVRGLVAEGGRYWVFGERPDGPGRVIREVTADEQLAGPGRSFTCGADLLPSRALSPAGGSVAGGAESTPDGAESRAATYTARMAVDTDYEYYLLFGSTAGAVSYIGDLFGYALTYYTTEVNTDFFVSYVSLWTTPADPWSETTSLCTLAEFGRYWNNNRSGVKRSLAHFLSGRILGGGIAWTSVLCSSWFNADISTWGCTLTPTVSNYGGDYGVSGDILGTFDINNPGIVWDIYAMSHEVGHNFSSPHTHCYVPPIDQCWGSEPGCYAGPASLPCPTPGTGCGTIMSYCHLISPGMTNISLTLGTGHPWGNNPQRVPQLMSSYVVTTAGTNPSCLVPIVFWDGFESGDTSTWSNTVP